jgi:transcriptional regulator
MTRRERSNLGSAILSAIVLPGVAYTQREIAAFWGTSWQNVDQTEKRALAKVRKHLEASGDLEIFRSVFEAQFDGRQIALKPGMHRTLGEL